MIRRELITPGHIDTLRATISGNGFMPLSRADVWLFSDPTLLGTIDIDENGELSGDVYIDGRVVPVGGHTLQL